MTAAHDYLPTPPPTRHRRRRQKTTPPPTYQSVVPKTVSRRPSEYRSKVTRLRTKPKQLPLALQFLLLVQKSSTTLTCGLVAITLGVYGWTVYAPTLWSQEFSKLKTLQRNERQLAATNESLKHKMAEQAEQPASGLTPPNPYQSIFLAPADVPVIEVRDQTQDTQQTPVITETPIAY
ncbi:conserved hypothetical protein [Crocosphaera subtropica ATCC 51142]|uniref:Cell division protein FtsL n=1 Tax=Crocosphaera subtropica (strain ATCC 51142 / BH68) TaxID=43989 RepID=B1WZ29_CROS5|nr:hypothetical protein [Crocosphaera subtropica]ACB52793.1 conserved hypothetical protein [Crocosphaera subtropica ATCC 51142]